MPIKRQASRIVADVVDEVTLSAKNPNRAPPAGMKRVATRKAAPNKRGPGRLSADPMKDSGSFTLENIRGQGAKKGTVVMKAARLAQYIDEHYPALTSEHKNKISDMLSKIEDYIDSLDLYDEDEE